MKFETKSALEVKRPENVHFIQSIVFHLTDTTKIYMKKIKKHQRL